MPIYCGNNRNDPKITGGTHTIGNNYECLRKGIGVGLHMPYDPAYTLPHAPIDSRKYYCGTALALPAAGGYFSTGSPSICFRSGIGVGKAQRARLGPIAPVGPAGAIAGPAAIILPRSYIRFLPIIIFVLICAIFFVIFYFGKFSFYMKKDDKTGENVIDYSKFIPYYILACLITGVIMYVIWRKLTQS